MEENKVIETTAEVKEEVKIDDSQGYIGDKIIKRVDPAGRKTLLGQDVLLVTYLTNPETEEEITKEMFDVTKTDKVSDATTLREKIAEHTAAKVTAMLLDSEIKIEYIDYILDYTVRSFNIKLDTASSKLWGKELRHRTMHDVEEVLTSKIEVLKTKHGGTEQK